MLKQILISTRPKQWIKNLLVFAGLVFAGELGGLAPALRAAGAFGVFCMLSAGVYLLNDVLDLGRDREHPVKCRRPLPSGALGTGPCLTASAVLVLAGLVCASFLGRGLTVIGAAYLVLNVLYSWRLKDLVIIDVMTIAAGFVLRVMAGTVVIGVETSHWLLFCTFLLSLFLGFGKRRHELLLLEEKAVVHRGVLAHYSPYFLDQMISIVATSTLVCYILYTVSERTVAHLGTTSLLYTVPFVIYGIFRYLFLIHRKQGGGDPAQLFFSDPSLMVDILLWLAVAAVVLYL